MSTPETQPLHVEVVLPPAPYALASSGFLATLQQVEAEIAAMVVETPQDAQAAANLQSRLTTAGNALEKQRKALKEPFLEAGRKIDEAAKAPAARIEAAKGAVKRLLTAYDQEQQRIAREAEAKRQEELRQLRLKAEAEERERQRVAAELAAKAAPLAQIPDETVALIANYNPTQLVAGYQKVGDLYAPRVGCSDTSPIYDGPAVFITAAAAEKQAQEIVAAARNFGRNTTANVEIMEFDDAPEMPATPPQKTETEKRIEELQHAPAVVAPKPAGVSFRALLVATVTDASKLPDIFVDRVPKMKAIRAALCDGWKDGDPLPVLDGVKFEVSRTPVSTGRNIF